MENTPHARAVLALCSTLETAGHTVVSANIDERAIPQVFAQSASGELAFYFLSVGQAEPDACALDRCLALAAKHGVAAYWATSGESGVRLQRLVARG